MQGCCGCCSEPCTTIGKCDGCSGIACERCTVQCSTCSLRTVCFECVDECDVCGRLKCAECLVDTFLCSCCGDRVDPQCAGRVCLDCLFLDLFATTRDHSFICSLCIQMCSDEKCNVQCIREAQTECPICLDAFTLDNFCYQACGLHKVCMDCNYDDTRGCPICREGKIE